MLNKKRTYGLGIWGLGLGYYLFYTPYSGLTKALSDGILPGVGRVPGPVLLPASVVATLVCMFGFITAAGWWKYAGRREVFGVSVPCPRPLTFLSGVCMATIIGTTTLAFTFGGASIVLMLVLLRGGVLVIAPVVDAVTKRRVRWFSWVAMLTSLLGVTVVLADTSNYSLSAAAVADVAAYFAAYFFKLQFMSRLAKTEEQAASRRYFVEEQMVATPLLVLALGAMAATGAGDVTAGFRAGFTTFLLSNAAWPALLVGGFYAGLCVCTTFIFLDRRENTFCVPMHCGSSMLSGVTASFFIAFFFQRPAPSAAQFGGAAVIIVALIFLSPLHHARYYVSFYGWLRRLARALAGDASVGEGGAASPETLARLPQGLLFICGGNTCRSPMAAAIGRAELAARLGVAVEELDPLNLRVTSAGVSARAGAPMSPDSVRALRLLNVPVAPHVARAVTTEMVNESRLILCMTEGQRRMVVELVPAAAGKTLCLDPDGDIEEPAGSAFDAYVRCARRMHELLKLRLDQFAAGALSQA